MSAATQKEKAIKVSGYLLEKRGIYQMILSWYDGNGKRGRRSISTGLDVKGNKKEAEDMLANARKEQALLLARASAESGIDKRLFADFMEEWLTVIKKDVKLTTYGGYQMNVQKVINPYFRKRGVTLASLTADDINGFYDDTLERQKATSIHKYHANISKALKYAVEKGYVEHSVMDKVKRPKAKRFVGKFLKKTEAVSLFNTVKGHKIELGVILGAYYGLRRGEIVGLKWEAIDFEANAITIEHTVTMATVDGKTLVIEGDTTKTKASFRTLPLVPSFRAKLLEVKAEQERNRKLCGCAYNKADKGYIYTDTLGYRIKPDYLTEEFPKFMVKNGFKRMRFHDLRHSCASLLLASGVPLKQIQEWLGHSDFAITANLYAHLEFSSKVESANAMTWIDKTEMGQAVDITAD